MANFNAVNLLEQLSSKGLVNSQELPDFVISQQHEKELPLYLRALVGVGAFIASLCLIGFLIATNIINFSNELGLIIWGLTFIVGAIGLQALSDDDKHSFLIQSSFASMAAGKSLFVFGAGKMLDYGWGGATLALLIITSITYNIYRMSIDRFLSSFAVLFYILLNILWDRDISGSRELLLNGFFLLQFAGAAILLTHGKIKRDYIPLSYAFVFSLCASVLFLSSHVEFGHWRHKELIHPAFINMILTGGLVALFGWAAGGIEKLKNKQLILASIGAVLLGLISAPGIILSIGLMIIGYAKHEELLIIAGALLMPIFLWLYYYNLDISLLQKSGIIIGSGVMLLAGRFYLKQKDWDQESASYIEKLSSKTKRPESKKCIMRTKIMIILLVIILAALNYSIYEKIFL